ncbi:MAG TPA: DUF4363 family protein [Clostridiales bacterium]|nr:DUF4363 family protein [Clostridiales bacterium]
MKMVVIATLLFLLVIAGWLIAYAHVDHVYVELSNYCSTLAESLEKQDWDHASQQLSMINEQWEKAKKHFNLFMNHEKIHDIELSLARTKQYIYKKELSLSLAEIEMLKRLLYMLKEDESLTISNIF